MGYVSAVVSPQGSSQVTSPRPAVVVVLAAAATADGDETSAPSNADRPYYKVDVEYCTGCRWMLRAAWIAQELLTTFQVGNCGGSSSSSSSSSWSSSSSGGGGGSYTLLCISILQ